MTKTKKYKVLQQGHLLTTEIRTECQIFATPAELCQKNKPNNLYFITTVIKIMAGNSTSSCAEADLSSPKPWQCIPQYSWL